MKVEKLIKMLNMDGSVKTENRIMSTYSNRAHRLCACEHKGAWHCEVGKGLTCYLV